MTIPSAKVFDIPELTEQVVQYLAPKEIVQCMRTCKALSNQLEQYLYHHVELKGPHPAPEKLVRYRGCVQILILPCNEPSNLKTLASTTGSKSSPAESLESTTHSTCAAAETLPPTSPLSAEHVFHHLRSISLVGNPRSLPQLSVCTEYFLQILDQSPHVTHLRLPAQILTLGNQLLVQQFLDSLANRTLALRRLTLAGDCVSPEIGLQFLEIAFKHPQLTNLHCDFSIGNRDFPKIRGPGPGYYHIDDPRFNALLLALRSTMQPDSDSAMEAAPIRSRIEALKLPDVGAGYPGPFMEGILRSHVPHLKWLYIPRIDTTDHSGLEEAVREGCRKLEHVICGEMTDDRFDECDVAAILRGCHGLESFCGLYFDDCDYFCQSRAVLWTLIQHHFNTLKTIELEYCGVVDSSDLQAMFSRCRKLKKFTITTGDGGQSAINFKDIVDAEWVCLDMEELELILARSERSKYESEDTSEDEGEDEEDYFDGTPPPKETKSERQTAQRVYAQIGRLTKLRILSLGCDRSESCAVGPEAFMFDLTLEHGWLAELEGLKGLREFRMMDDFYSKMGQAEVEFIEANWPKIEKIVFGSHCKDQALSKPHWQWLKEKRPSLRFE
ncbi:hypothetical protein B0O80DRAFT_499786 [Mortierella sp. GBAus27b]|nr:hypothetical protein B0O80DRAFT_499786 [Mortierella sp. GBAus27b]